MRGRESGFMDGVLVRGLNYVFHWLGIDAIVYKTRSDNGWNEIEFLKVLCCDFMPNIAELSFFRDDNKFW